MKSVVEVSPVEVPQSKAATSARVQIAYLLSGYPAFSLTFVLNEIVGLRKLGIDIVTASINPCDQPAATSEEVVRNEEANTYYIKRAGVAGFIGAFFSALFHNPLGVLRGFLFTLGLGGNPIRFFYFMEALIVGAWMRRHGRTHLHTHFGGAVASVAMITARTFPITMSLTLHGPDEFWDVSRYYLAKKLETASFVCCISFHGRSQLMLHSSPAMWDKFVVARLGVDTERFSPRRRNTSSDSPLEIVCVGRLVGAKGQHILVSAFNRLIKEGRNVRLRLVGKGPDRESLEAAVASYGIQKHVIFEGAVGADRVRQILDDVAIFTLPSFAEGIPVALMEAMAMEIPCVSTTIAGIPELIRDQIDGFLVSPSDDVQLAEALARLVDEPDLRRRIGAAGRQRVLEHYELHQSIKNLGEVFQCRL
jgi:glycosyltransferase involved in cell wall biosynthesis